MVKVQSRYKAAAEQNRRDLLRPAADSHFVENSNRLSRPPVIG
jgi:hypothetical protein